MAEASAANLEVRVADLEIAVSRALERERRLVGILGRLADRLDGLQGVPLALLEIETDQDAVNEDVANRFAELDLRPALREGIFTSPHQPRHHHRHHGHDDDGVVVPLRVKPHENDNHEGGP
jgi:hypothetical protein